MAENEGKTQKILGAVLAALLLAMEEGLSPTDAASSPFDDVDLGAPSQTLPARDTQLGATNADTESTKAKKSKLARARRSRACQPSDDEDVDSGSHEAAALKKQRSEKKPKKDMAATCWAAVCVPG